MGELPSVRIASEKLVPSEKEIIAIHQRIYTIGHQS
jgi:hypothetical protein